MVELRLRADHHRVPHRVCRRSAARGRVIDRLGTRTRPHASAVAFYSVAAMLTSMASGLAASPASGSCWARANRRTGPAPRRPSPSGSRGVRAVGPWRCSTPARRSAGGCALSGFRASRRFGNWRPAFIVTGALGFLWLFAFRRMYYSPGVAPADHGRRAPDPRDRDERDSGSAVPASGCATTPSSAAADLGHRHRQGADRSGVVLHHRLVRDLPGRRAATRSRTA